MNKPKYISYKDWELLNQKYSSKQLEEYFNNNYPYQYLIGNVDFCDNIINVDERVLIPRFETEELVYKTLDLIKKNKLDNLKITDLCTGSGCIAISLKKEINCEIDAIDISEEALELARLNSKNNEVNINFIKRDVLSDDKLYKYDLVISNPPYIDKSEKVGQSTKYEPQIALFANNKGLAFYEKILSNYWAKIYAFEIGCTQKKEVINIATKKYPQAKIFCEKDMNGLDRFIFIINE